MRPTAGRHRRPSRVYWRRSRRCTAPGSRSRCRPATAQPLANSIMTSLGWTVGETLDALVTSDTVTASRPAPYLIFRAMEATGVRDVRRVPTAGDTPNDLGAGMNAGAGFVVGVTTGSFTRSQLEAEPHTHILDSVAELPALL